MHGARLRPSGLACPSHRVANHTSEMLPVNKIWPLTHKGGDAVGAGRERVAVLGGGPAALAAAFALSAPELEDRFEVTVYQAGWRLGGKCASGRNLEERGRIEEHGLHVWFGF